MAGRRNLPGEGTISQRTRTRADGSTYQQHLAAITIGGRRVYRYARTQREALAALRDLRQSASRGEDLARGNVPLGAYLEAWLTQVAQPRVRPSTYQTYRMYVVRHLQPGLGTIRLARLTPANVQLYLNRELAAGLAPRTVAHLRAILRRALNIALRWDLVTRNAAALTDPPHIPDVQRERLSSANGARTLLEVVARDRLGALYTLALALGMRQGQVLGLRWADVDFGRGAVSLVCSLQRHDRQYVLVEPKTTASRHTLPLPDAIADRLRAHQAVQAAEAELAGEAWRNRFGLVFTTAWGEPLNASWVTHHFQQLLRRAGLRPMRFHDLRGSCSTFLGVLRVHPRVMMELLGHSDVATTMRIYTEAPPPEQRQALEDLAGLLFPFPGRADGPQP